VLTDVKLNKLNDPEANNYALTEIKVKPLHHTIHLHGQLKAISPLNLLDEVTVVCLFKLIALVA
jgi:hypothetical protein